MEAAKRDFRYSSKKLNAYIGSDNEVLIEGMGMPCRMTDHCLSQFASTHTPGGIKTLKKFRNEHPDLLVETLNTMFNREADVRLYRTLQNQGSGEGTLRAILSKQYRIFDSIDLWKGIKPVLDELPGLRYESHYLGYDGFRIKVFWPGNSVSPKVGETVYAGAEISANEIGTGGAYRIVPMSMVLSCTNGAKYNASAFSRAHITRQHSKEYATILSAEAVKAGEYSVALEARDILKHVLTGTFIQMVGRQMQEAMGQPVTLDSAKEILEEVELPARYSDEVMDELFSSGDNSLFGLANAVNFIAHSGDQILEAGSVQDQYLESTSLEEISGAIMNRVLPFSRKDMIGRVR
ncbi:MAG: hypothetical protein AAFY17_12180 [Cyanobacteria bacterium J06642_11]